jgi:4-hydroxy-tetrahydrodipicolinate reductase
VPPLRVVQWATGNIGTRSLQQVIRHPGLELVGLLVYDPAKDGVDAGQICGERPTGVLATTDRQQALALEADCVLYMPRAADVDDVVALLERGTNIVTSCGEFGVGGGGLEEAARRRVTAACLAGGTSIYATGSSPGFITDALPFALLSLQRTVDLVQIDEFADLSRRDSPHLLFEQMGFGQPIGPVAQLRADYLLGQFAPSLAAIAAAAGRPVDTWSATGEVAAAVRRTEIVAGEIAEGTAAAFRTTLSGSHGGAEIVRFCANWYCTAELDPAWTLRDTGWRVRIAGDAPFDVALPFPVPLAELGAFTPAYTANRPVNAVAYVCAAAPGILRTEQLPMITPAGPVAAS